MTAQGKSGVPRQLPVRTHQLSRLLPMERRERGAGGCSLLPGVSNQPDGDPGQDSRVESSLVFGVLHPLSPGSRSRMWLPGYGSGMCLRPGRVRASGGMCCRTVSRVPGQYRRNGLDDRRLGARPQQADLRRPIGHSLQFSDCSAVYLHAMGPDRNRWELAVLERLPEVHGPRFGRPSELPMGWKRMHLPPFVHVYRRNLYGCFPQLLPRSRLRKYRPRLVCLRPARANRAAAGTGDVLGPVYPLLRRQHNSLHLNHVLCVCRGVQ